MKIESPCKLKGRPRQFDSDVVLDRALRVFFEKGYEGASLPDLTKAMGINKPSLYTAFGNKEQLFLKAVDRYMQQSECGMNAALAQPSVREAVRAWLSMGLCNEGGDKTSRGCLLVQGALACSDDSQRVRKELAMRRAAGELALRGRLDQAVSTGDLPPHTDTAALAKYFATFHQGLAVQLNAGAPREELAQAIDVALKAIPA